MLKICPATSNLPTVMTAASWKALCKATFKKETAATMSGFPRVASESYCSKCQGKIKPPKLKIVSPEEMLAKTPTNKELPMTTRVSNRGTCDCCEDKNLVLRNNYGKKMCGKCASMYSNVRNWLPIIEMALADIWPDKYGPGAKQLAASNPDAVKVAVDEKTDAVLKQIAALVGYEGDDPEEMVGHVAASEAMLEHIQRSAAKTFIGMVINQEDIPGLFARFAASSDALREQTRFIVTIRDLLGMPVSHLGDLAATLTEKLELLGEYSTTMDRTTENLTISLHKQEDAEKQVERREAALWELVNAMDDIVDDRDELYRLLYNDARKEDAGSNEPNNLTATQQAIANQCDHLKATLLEKNRKYGNSALEPVRLFSKVDPVEQIRVRIDDKLSRMKSAQIDDTEDVELDLAGYLVLLKVANGAA